MPKSASQAVDLGDRPAQLFEGGGGPLAERVAAGRERFVERAVVPADRVALAGLEAVPEAVAVGPVVEQDRAGVVELVGERDAQLVRLLVGNRVEVRALALIPGRLGLGFAVGVGAGAAVPVYLGPGGYRIDRIRW